MILQAGKSYLETGSGERIAEITSWSESQSGSKQDISILGNVDANGRPKKRYMPGAAETTLSISGNYDPTDSAQSNLRQGVTGLTLVIYTGGNESGLEKRTYANCSIESSDLNGDSIDGLVTFSASVTCDVPTLETIA